MKVELKSIKHAKSLSEETNAFTADVYLNDIKVGRAKNEGHGGSSSVTPYPDYAKNQKLIDEAEAYFLKLPKETTEFEGTSIEIQPDFGSHIDDLIHADLVRLDSERFRKNMSKKFLTHICFGNPNDKEQYGVLKLSRPVEELLKTEKGTAYLTETIKWVQKQMKSGHIILNDNISHLIKA